MTAAEQPRRSAARPPVAHRWLRPSRVSIQSKLMLILLVTSVLSVALVGYVEFRAGAGALQHLVVTKLVQIRDSQSRAVRMLFTELTNSVVDYSHEAQVIDAVQAFSAGFDELAKADLDADQQRALTEFYRNDVIGTLAERTGEQVELRAVLPSTPAQKYLQSHYTTRSGIGASDSGVGSHDRAADSEPTGRPTDTGDGSRWSAANARFDDYFAGIAERNGYSDALLLDRHGNVVYSVNKGIDLGTNILTGPYQQTKLRDAYRKAAASNTVDFVWISDYGRYQPHLDVPTAWLTAPVKSDGSLVGVLALPLPSARINRIMTVNRHWDDSGLGTTTEIYLAGPDDLMRSDSRVFLEDPQEYRRRAIAAGTPEDTVDRALRLGTTALVQPVGSPGLDAAQAGNTGTLDTGYDYLGARELSAYAPLNIANSDLQWSILATRDYSDAFEGVTTFTKNIVLTTVAIILLVCLLAMLLARAFLRPVQRLRLATQRISAGDYDVSIPVRSRDEIGELTNAFNVMSESLRTKQELLDEQRRQNDELLLSLMPEPVVRRYREGRDTDETIASEHHNVTVVYAEVLGIDPDPAAAPSGELVELMDDLFRQFDAAAETAGVERIRTMHNGYLAGCGIAVPRLDNVSRAVEFAREMQRIVGRADARVDHPLHLWAAVNTGQAVSGLVGQAGIAYDLWGPAVSLAYGMRAGTAMTAGIYVTEPVYDVMRESCDFTPSEPVTVGSRRFRTWRLTD